MAYKMTPEEELEEAYKYRPQPGSYVPYQIPGEDEPQENQLDLRPLLKDVSGESGLTPGWYRNTSTTGLVNNTGMPQTTAERNRILDYFNQYGVRPTSRETAGTETGEEAQYIPGSTSYEYGFRNQREYDEAQRYGINFGPWSGKYVPLDSVVTTDEQGNPYMRFPNETVEAAQPFIQSGKYITDRTRSDIYPQRTIPKPYQAPPEGVVLSNLDQNALTQIRGEVLKTIPSQQLFSVRMADYLDSQIKMGLITEEQAATVADDILKQIEAGVPVEDLPEYKQVQNYEGQYTKAFIEQMMTPYIQQMKDAYLKQDRARYERGIAAQDTRPGWTYGMGGTPAKQPTPLETALNTEKPTYDTWVSTLPVDMENQIWMQRNYPALVEEWMTYGQGRQFIDWVKERLKGQLEPPRTDSRRFAPPVRYAR